MISGINATVRRFPRSLSWFPHNTLASSPEEDSLRALTLERAEMGGVKW